MSVICPRCYAAVVPYADGTCPSCGALIAAISPAAAPLTGRPAGEAETPPRPVPSAPGRTPSPSVIAFYRELRQLTPHTYVTQGLILANVGVFLAMVVGGVHFLAPGAVELIGWGANFGPMTLSGQWWRLLSSAFVHVGVIHLAVNMWVLYNIGPLVERLLGSVGFALTYLTAAIFGSLASLVWNASVTSAGASGAVFGLFGALLGFVVLRRKSIPLQAFRSITNSTVMFVLFNLAFGLSIPGIDNAAHMGGLFAGLLCGMVLSQPISRDSVRRRRLLNTVLLVVAAAAVFLAIPWMPAAPADVQSEVARFGEQHNQLQQRYQEAAARWQSGKITAGELATVLEREIQPGLAALRQRMENLSNVPPASRQRLAQWIEYAREESYRLLAAALRSKNAGKQAAHLRAAQAADKLLEQLNRAAEERM